jgi:putative restriction endonuclease
VSLKLFVGITDRDWYELLRQMPHLDEVNFWAPGGTPIKALNPGEMFLFKLHAPHHFIVGGGMFAYSSILPCSLAWETFGQANGARAFGEMRSRIARYRRVDTSAREDFLIGCRVLEQPFFLEEPDWIPAPPSWPRQTVQGKTYTTVEAEGAALWEAVSIRLQAQEAVANAARYGKPVLVPPRLGQGAFRLLVTDTYRRRCAVTEERTLPALDAAHVRPYAEGGAHEVRNGLLLRRDIHSLFDRGYVTVTPDMRFEVSGRIKEEFENGRHYYALHGGQVHVPNDLTRRPDPQMLTWHNENRFLG